MDKKSKKNQKTKRNLDNRAEEKKHQHLKLSIVLIRVGAACAALILFVSMYANKSAISAIKSLETRNTQLEKQLESTQGSYDELEQSYQELKKNESAKKQQKTSDLSLTKKDRKCIFGEDAEVSEAEDLIEIVNHIKAVDEDFEDGWKDHVAKGIAQLLETEQINDAVSVTFLDKLAFSVDNAAAYTAYINDDVSRQIGIVYYPAYDEYLYFYQKLPQKPVSDDQDTNSGNPVTSSQPGTTVITRTTESRNGQDTIQEETGESGEGNEDSKDFLVNFDSTEILAYLDSEQNLTEQLINFLVTSGYEGGSCHVQDFEVDNQNNYVMFSILVNDDSIAGVYDRNSGSYTFDLQ